MVRKGRRSVFWTIEGLGLGLGGPLSVVDLPHERVPSAPSAPSFCDDVIPNLLHEPGSSSASALSLVALSLGVRRASIGSDPDDDAVSNSAQLDQNTSLPRGPPVRACWLAAREAHVTARRLCSDDDSVAMEFIVPVGPHAEESLFGVHEG